jgi:hypothetical protein
LFVSGGGEIVFQAPYAYQDTAMGRVEIASGYVIHDNGDIGFALDAYDTNRTLVIAPILSYSTLLGGPGFDAGNRITVDAQGDIYILGETGTADFPINTGAVSGASDAYIAKFAPNTDGSSHLVFATYLGGSGEESSSGGIQVNQQGEIIVHGVTTSRDLPTTRGAYDTSFGGRDDTFIAKVNSTGDSLLYSSYYGGNHNDIASGRVLDDAGNVYITSHTQSTKLDTVNAYDTSRSGGSDFYAEKLNLAGGRDVFFTALDTTIAGSDSLVYSSYFGGSDRNEAYDITLGADGKGGIYITRTTSSNDYEATGNAYETKLQGSSDAYVVKITMDAVNAAPVAVTDNTVTNEDTSVIVNTLSNDMDVDGKNLFLSSVTQGDYDNVFIHGNYLIYNPETNFHGKDNFMYTVRDTQRNTDTTPLEVSMQAQNNQASLQDDIREVHQDAVVTIDVLENDFDVDNDILNIVSVTQGTNGKVLINNDKTITYTPIPGFSGEDMFTYTVDDGNQNFEFAFVKITVAANSAYTLSSDIFDLDTPETLSSTVTTAINFTIHPNESSFTSSENIHTKNDMVSKEYDIAQGNNRMLTKDHFEHTENLEYAMMSSTYKYVLQFTKYANDISQTASAADVQKNINQTTLSEHVKQSFHNEHSWAAYHFETQKHQYNAAYTLPEISTFDYLDGFLKGKIVETENMHYGERPIVPFNVLMHTWDGEIVSSEAALINTTEIHDNSLSAHQFLYVDAQLLTLRLQWGAKDLYFKDEEEKIYGYTTLSERLAQLQQADQSNKQSLHRLMHATEELRTYNPYKRLR